MLSVRTSIMARCAGFSLIEVLITVVVLSMGLLGLASLQATTLRVNSGAVFRSQATNLAYDIADRMRVNRTAAIAGAYDSAMATPTTCQSVTLAGTMAAQDLQAWYVLLACNLPQGTGSIVRNGTTVTIVIQWDDSRAQGGSVQQFQMVTAL